MIRHTNGSRFEHRKRVLLASTAIAVLLTVVGCSGQTSGNSGDTINIGLPHPLTGAWADGGQNALNGAMLAIEDINAAGGIKSLDGLKLKGVQADTSSDDPGQAATVTRRLIEQENVSALIGSYVSAFTITASTEAEKAGVPILSQSYADTLTDRDYSYFFQLPPTATALGQSIVPYVQDAYAEIGITLQKVSVLASDDASIEAQGRAAIAEAESAGLDVVSQAFYPQALSDATVIVLEALRADPDVIFLGGPTGAAVTIVNTLRSLDYEGPIVGLGGGGILSPDFGKLLGDNVDGILSQAGWNWDMPYDGLEDISTRYTQEYDTKFMPQEAGESYVAAWILAGAIDDAASTDPEKIAEVLRKTDFTSGPASFMPAGTVSFDTKGLNEDVFPIMIQWQEGVTRTVWPLDVQASKPQ
ncbi:MULTISPECIES: ABC transporter substrate-binding protein [unclassified Cryobacterium]|uniref:ABC transporter substrate-binding protein n=1 Tax=unclassified Cryobacterium TaxID=2649013 RepID=UPI00106A0AF1|nr:MULTISPECIES: ABC transporter substrate-binding protein [unclassified Cryobacterium]TFD02974.1 hypothetical protein E3T29_18570 [Cryobacterium sp. TMT1-66-1]TFD15341.1 hypothetical protein E3T35_00125 [Cryobacterium sp. TMT1-2-2]